LVSQNAQTIRAAYLSMQVTTWVVIVPLSVATLLTGIVQSLGTTWGLFRHHWVVAKLGLTVVATVILLVHTQPIGRVATVAAEKMLSSADLCQLRIQLVADSAAALFALLVATTLSVYKPWGLTSYGRREDVVAMNSSRASITNPFWSRLWLLGVVVAVTLFVILHLMTGGMGHH
jgi:hypothetical protein